MSNENKDKDMKKKVTVVGAIALSAVLASGMGYTSYNLLNDKNNDEHGSGSDHAGRWDLANGLLEHWCHPS